jgi:hypothetical protein
MLFVLLLGEHRQVVRLTPSTHAPVKPGLDRDPPDFRQEIAVVQPSPAGAFSPCERSKLHARPQERLDALLARLQLAPCQLRFSHGALLDSRRLLDGMAMHPEMNLNLELIEAATILRHEQVLLHRLEKRGISGVEVGVNEM